MTHSDIKYYKKKRDEGVVVHHPRKKIEIVVNTVNKKASKRRSK